MKISARAERRKQEVLEIIKKADNGEIQDVKQPPT
jgi:hypothetical protein